MQKTVQGDSAAYHGYWGRDLTSVDPHLGTNDDFAGFVDCAHRLGLKIYLDIVVNHTADVISLVGGTSFRDPAEAPYRDCRGKPFVAQRYAGGKRFPCVSSRYQPRQPSLQPRDRSLKRPAWLNDVTRYHNRGDIDFSGCSPVCFEQGDFFGLDDLFTEQPFVVAGLAQTYGDWIRRYELDGFRVDTAKHVDRAFFRSWVPRIRAVALAAGVSDFEIFGEVFLTDAIELSAYARDRALPNVIDFPLQDSLVRYAGGSAGRRDRHAVGRRRLLPRPERRRADARDLPRQPRHRPRRAPHQAADRFAGSRAGTPRAARAQPALSPARGAGRLLRRRGRDDRARRRQGGAPGHVPDEGQRVAGRGARGRAADRDGLVFRHRPCDPPCRIAPARAGKAPRRSPRTRHRLLRRTLCERGAARGQPVRPRGPA